MEEASQTSSFSSLAAHGVGTTLDKAEKQNDMAGLMKTEAASSAPTKVTLRHRWDPKNSMC